MNTFTIRDKVRKEYLAVYIKDIVKTEFQSTMLHINLLRKVVPLSQDLKHSNVHSRILQVSKKTTVYSLK